MARIRSSKPEWWKSAKWCRVSRDIRATYKGIWEVMCDDEGRFLADPRQVKADVWPLDDDITPKKLAAWLPQLAQVQVTLEDGSRTAAVQFYTIDSVSYGYLPGFVKHQKISHPTASKLPKPPFIDRSNSGMAPEVSGATPDNIPPDKDRDVDVDFDLEVERDVEGESAPRVVLPREATAFLAQFYEPAFTEPSRKRYRDILKQLYETLDPLHPGPKIRGGTRVKARSVEHFVDELNAVMRDPPPDRDLAIVWFLKRLTNPPKGPSVTEMHKREEEAERQIEERYNAAAKAAGIQWANENPELYKPIAASVEVNYHGKTGSFIAIAKTAELTQRCAKAAGFPPFEKWREAHQLQNQLQESVA